MKNIINIFKDLKIELNVNLAPYTTWKIGGPAKYFWEPQKINRIPEVVRFCSQNDIKVYYLGRGSNSLINSNGLSGLVICTKRVLQKISVDDSGIIYAEAGVPMPKLSSFASKLGYGGYEYLIGIPGSTGAGIAINAGLTAEGRREIGDVLIDAQLIDKKGNIFTEGKEQLNLGYRSSNILDRNLFVLSARFKATYKSSKEEIRAKTVEHLKKRRNKQPLSKPTCGSTFKQPEGGMAAGWYIDEAGLKGLKIGGAKVSEKHANWIENDGTATSDDILSIVSEIKKSVLGIYDIELETEFRYLN